MISRSQIAAWCATVALMTLAGQDVRAAAGDVPKHEAPIPPPRSASCGPRTPIPPPRS